MMPLPELFRQPICGIRNDCSRQDNGARRFYEHFNFDPSPTDPYQFYLLIKDLGAQEFVAADIAARVNHQLWVD